MTVQAEPEPERRRVVQARRHHKFLPLTATIGLFVVMFGLGSVLFDNFFAFQVFLNFFVDNAVLAIASIGMTFVILSGGIDLSVGSVIALTTMMSASLVTQHGWGPATVIPLVLVLGALGGLVMGLIIQYFEVQPFIVTLAWMFIARGLCYVISIDSIAIENELYSDIAMFRLPLPFETSITANALIALGVLALAVYALHYTRFGRTVYAIGGNQQSALLMGLPVARTKVLVYTLSGFCSALAGVATTFNQLSGWGQHAQGTELDAIAAVVIGGTLLSGGSGYVVGTMFGVLIFGTIQSAINFQGDMSSWWIKIVIGLLLFGFCVLQLVFTRRRK